MFSSVYKRVLIFLSGFASIIIGSAFIRLLSSRFEISAAISDFIKTFPVTLFGAIAMGIIITLYAARDR